MHLVRSGDPTTATKNGPRSPPSCAVGLIKRDGQTDGDAMPTALRINVQATNYTMKIQVAAPYYALSPSFSLCVFFGGASSLRDASV